MLSRKVRLQIFAFVLIALVGVSYAGARYAGLARLFGPTGYQVNVQLADAGGVFDNAEVTYRGVPVGRVGTLQLTGGGVSVPLQIDDDAPKIPRDVQAVVADRSAVGEQYVDLRPRHDSGPYLKDGSSISQQNTEIPPPVQDLTMNLDKFAKSVPEDSLRTVTSELGTAFRNNGGNLQTIIDTTREFTDEAQKHVPQTKQLLSDGNQVLRTQNEQGSSIESWSKDLNKLSGQLKSSDPDLRKVIAEAPPAAQQVDATLRENTPQLTQLLGNLTTTSQLLATKRDGIEQLMVTYPAAAGGGYSVLPGDHKAHFGLVVNEFNPLPCTAGYEGTQPRAGNDTRPSPVNTGAHCAEPPNSTTDVRGARNAPTN